MGLAGETGSGGAMPTAETVTPPSFARAGARQVLTGALDASRAAPHGHGLASAPPSQGLEEL